MLLLLLPSLFIPPLCPPPTTTTFSFSFTSTFLQYSTSGQFLKGLLKDNLWGIEAEYWKLEKKLSSEVQVPPAAGGTCISLDVFSLQFCSRLYASTTHIFTQTHTWVAGSSNGNLERMLWYGIVEFNVPLDTV